MSLDASIILSLISLIVAIATGLAAHHYFQRAERQRGEDLIQSALAKFARSRADATTLKRERSKTGLPLDSHEHSLFEQLDSLTAMQGEAEKELIEFLSSGKKITSEIKNSALTMIATTESLNVHVQMISAKLQNFNNNRVGKLLELQKLLPQLEEQIKVHLRNP
ncbi:hypothetical protein [Uliginosibacterium sp. H1]|uniref:hypothetical protein n=1 Tax=Uliginosibacterium sp. H1 TaxID=3114757 RepID=UPI002E16EF93|nr:hypothetical protein [Uliginosibacterium sp. H1]